MERKYVVGLLIVVIALCCYVELGCGSGNGANATASQSSGTTTTGAPSGGSTPSSTGQQPSTPGEVLYVSSYYCTPGNTACADGKSGDGVLAYTIDPSTGNLQALPASPYNTGSFALALAATPSGSFLYVANVTSVAPGSASLANTGNIATFSVDPSTGALNRLPTTTTINYPVTMSIDPKGRFLYVSEGAQLDGFSIDGATGALSPLPGSPFIGLEGTALAFDPTGTFLYIAGGDLYGYRINSNTGALTPVPGSPYNPNISVETAVPTSVTMHPSGKYVYATVFIQDRDSEWSECLYGYSVDPATGALIPLNGYGTFFCAQNLNNLVFNSDGSAAFAIVANNQVMQVSFDPSTGNLQFPPSGQTAYLGGPAILDASGNYLYAVAGIPNEGVYGFHVGDLMPLSGAPWGSEQAAGWQQTMAIIARH